MRSPIWQSFRSSWQSARLRSPITTRGLPDAHLPRARQCCRGRSVSGCTTARAGNQGADTSYGGSITALWRTGSASTCSSRLLGEQQTYHGFPAAFMPLPSAFLPSYASDRASNIQPSASDEWTLSALDLDVSGHGLHPGFLLQLLSTAREPVDVEDSTYGIAQQVLASVYQVSGLPAQPFGWIGNHVTGKSPAKLEFRLSRSTGGAEYSAYVLFKMPAPTSRCSRPRQTV